MFHFETCFAPFSKVGMTYHRESGYLKYQCLGLPCDSSCMGSRDPKEGVSTKIEEVTYVATRWGQSLTDFTQKVIKGNSSVHSTSKFSNCTGLITKRLEMAVSFLDTTSCAI